jgi:DNA polymerase-3 subunit beta
VTFFHAEHGDLLKAVEWASRALPGNPVVPVLAGMLIEVGEEDVVVSAYDTATGASARLPVKASEPGRFVAPGKLFHNVLKSLDGGHVEVEFTEGPHVEVSGGGAGFQLITMAAEDYPTLPSLPESCGTVAGGELMAALKAVEYGTGDFWESSNIRMDAMLIEVTGDRLTFVTTDRHRVPVTSIAWDPADVFGDFSVIVSPSALYGFAKGAHGPVSLALPRDGEARGLLGLSCEGRTLITSPETGEFPKWRRAMELAVPEMFAEVDKAELRGALKRACQVLEDKKPVQLTFMEGCVQVDSGGESTMAEVVGAKVRGEGRACRYNPKLLDKALEVAPADQVLLQVTKEDTMLLKASGDGVDYRQLVMPQRAA